VLEASAGTDAERARLDTDLGGVLSDIDQAFERVLEVRARLGTRLNVVDSERSRQDGLRVQTESALSELRDLDYAEATARLQTQLATYQASQQAFARVQGLSLFDYL
jgi:flagellar hook-associated protein 3 FlgL